mgnify:FL=1
MGKMKGTAGREKPQDCIVTVDLERKSGIEIQLNSKMEKMFGDAIQKAIREALSEMNVKAANVKVDDFGSLDFVIKARIKTAVKRARGDLNG